MLLLYRNLLQMSMRKIVNKAQSAPFILAFLTNAAVCRAIRYQSQSIHAV